jgi:uncharacterized protein DUF6650
MAKSRSTGRRVTGGSGSALGFGLGLSTTATATDRDIVQALVVFLEDRRALFNADYLEVQSQVDHSVIEIRKELTEALQQLEPTSPAVPPIRSMRAACRRYLDNPRQQFRLMGRSGVPGQNVPGFFVALGELRAIFGVELKQLDDRFGLDIEPQLRELFLPAD